MSESLDPGKGARTATGIPVVPAFDGYRAWAILLVVVYHVCLYNGVVVAAGDSWHAVVIFGWLAEVPLTMLFTISGFVLFLPTVARNGEFGRVGAFAIRRAARILPAYWLGLVIAIVILALLPDYLSVPNPVQVLLHLFMLQTPAALLDNGSLLGFGIVAAVWTLSVETVFYFLLPLIAVPFYKRPLAGLAIAALMLVAWRVFSLHIADIGNAFGIDVSSSAEVRWSNFYSRQFPSWGLSIACGMAGAWAFVRLRQRIAPDQLARQAKYVALAAFAATVVVAAFAGHDAIDHPNFLQGLFSSPSLFVALALPLVVATAMIAVALSPLRVQAPFANGPMRYLGDISYGIYLIHLAVIVVISETLGLSTNGTLLALLAWSAIVIPVSIGYGYLSATYVEHPVRLWARRFTRRGQPPREAPATAER